MKGNDEARIQQLLQEADAHKDVIEDSRTSLSLVTRALEALDLEPPSGLTMEKSDDLDCLDSELLEELRNWLKEKLLLQLYVCEKKLREHLNLEERPDPVTDQLWRSVDELEMSVRAANCLSNANIELVGDLVTKTQADLLRTKNFGRMSLKEITRTLAQRGLCLGMQVEGWPRRGVLHSRLRK